MRPRAEEGPGVADTCTQVPAHHRKGALAGLFHHEMGCLSGCCVSQNWKVPNKTVKHGQENMEMANHLIGQMRPLRPLSACNKVWKGLSSSLSSATSISTPPCKFPPPSDRWRVSGQGSRLAVAKAAPKVSPGARGALGEAAGMAAVEGQHRKFASPTSLQIWNAILPLAF